MLRWQDVSFSYEQSGKNEVLSAVDLEVPLGRITVITGPSGCGKSTLLYLAAGIYPKNAGILKSGRVSFDGQDISSLIPRERARIVGMMFQNPDLQFCMDTVENELIFCLENVCEESEHFKSIIDDALGFAGIRHLRRRRLSTLSGGEKQKAALACLAALRPKWLLLDEPFANIDDDAAVSICRKLKKMNESFGTSVVAVDHHTDIWSESAHEIVVLQKNGRLSIRGLDPRSLPCGLMEESGVDCAGLPYRRGKQEKNTDARGTALHVENLTVMTEEVPILENCNATFQCGRIHAITGKSGCGKSTFFNALCRLSRYEGSIRINGMELKKIAGKKYRKLLGFVFQNPQDQFVTGRVLDEITIGFKKVPETKRMDKAEKILRGIGLWRYRFVSPYRLSQGQQRRLAVASLLSYDCGILVCDEPTYAQDRRSLTALMDSLYARVLESGLTLIFSTHDKKLAMEYADHIYEIKEGQINEIGPSGL